MNIANNMVVGVHYQLEVDGNKIDASKEEPLVYLHGKGMMIPGF
jgi:FKBP-type peptidyl-prolyl cis-trans isomerase 2